MTQISTPERHLDLRTLLNDLQSGGLLDQETVDKIIVKPRLAADTAKHPLNYIAEQDAESPDGSLLTAEVLTQWLAEKAGLPVFHIDPLKVKLDRFF